jgi:hypothetical protein
MVIAKLAGFNDAAPMAWKAGAPSLLSQEQQGQLQCVLEQVAPDGGLWTSRKVAFWMAEQAKLRGCRGQRARSEKFFLRMYGKLFVLMACVAQNVPSKTGRCRIPHAYSWHVHTRTKVECCSRLIHRR